MFFDPSIHLEIAHQRQEDLLARSKHHELVKAALAARRDRRGRRPVAPIALETPSPKGIIRPKRANA